MPLITSTRALGSLVERARRLDHVALDTEFVWERTYYPRLGLVQIGLTRDEVHLVDAPAVDLALLGELLADAAVTKIFHGAEQDLAILARQSRALPVNVFDTQLAAGFVGLSASASLQALVAHLTGTQLAKNATRSDWLLRPLSAAQIEYAREDVRYLPAVYEALRERLRARGRLAWAQAEMRHYERPERYVEEDPRLRYRATKGTAKRGFGGRDYAVLRELAAWREVEARRRDRPRGHILSDDALVAIASRKPVSAETLMGLRGVHGAAVERDADAIVAAVKRGLASPREDWPQRPARPLEDTTLQSRLDLMQAVIRGRAEREGIDQQLVATRQEVEALVRSDDLDPDRHALLQGWRRTFIGADLEALLRRRAAVALDERGLPVIVPIQ